MNMRNLKNNLYPEVGHYLRDSVQTYMFKAPYKEDIEELSMEDSFSIVRNRIILKPGLIYVILPNTTYEHIKTRLITSYFSPDDQIALLLEKDHSEEDREKYNYMMEWREYLTKKAKLIYEYKLSKYPE